MGGVWGEGGGEGSQTSGDKMWDNDILVDKM